MMLIRIHCCSCCKRVDWQTQSAVWAPLRVLRLSSYLHERSSAAEQSTSTLEHKKKCQHSSDGVSEYKVPLIPLWQKNVSIPHSTSVFSAPLEMFTHQKMALLHQSLRFDCTTVHNTKIARQKVRRCLRAAE